MHSTGCGGGGKKEATAETGTQAGSVTTVEISPSPGTVFIGRSTTFQLAWTHNAPPPTFTAVLVRYKDEDGSGSEQRTTLTRQGDSFVWNLNRDGNYDLESPGVYYVELTSGAETYRAAYIVSRDRSVPITKTAETAPSTHATKGGRRNDDRAYRDGFPDSALKPDFLRGILPAWYTNHGQDVRFCPFQSGGTSG